MRRLRVPQARALAVLMPFVVVAACTGGSASHDSAPAPSALVMYQQWSEPPVDGALEVLDPGQGSSSVLSPGFWGVPAWSPDGTLVAVGQKRRRGPGCFDSCADLVLMSPIPPVPGLLVPSGRVVRRLTAGPGTSDTAIWSPDGRRLAYAYTDNVIDGPSHIEIINSDGTGRRRLSGDLGNPVAWSPDGSSLLVVAPVSDETWLLPLAGGGAQLLLPPDVDGERDHPQRHVRILHDVILSPDGRQVFFTRDTGTVDRPSVRLYSMDIRTKAIRQLTTDALQPENPALSPDGTQLAFVGYLPTKKDFCGPSALFVMSSAGGAPRRVSPPMQMGLIAPSWSSDGTSLTFAAQDANHDCVADDSLDGSLYRTELSTGRTQLLGTGVIARTDGVVAVQPTGSH